MGNFTESAPTKSLSPEAWFVGRAYFFLKDPQAALDAGLDRVKVERRKKPSDPWTEITTADTRRIVDPKQVNYTHLDPKASRGWQYRPVLSSSTNAVPDVPQDPSISDVVDTSFETLATIAELRDFFMWGLLGLFMDDVGNPFPDRLYVHFMQYGITKFETKTRIKLFPTKVTEAHAYSPAEWVGRYWTFPLDEFPCVPSVNPTITLKLPGQADFTLPDSWVRFDARLGMAYVVPDGSLPLPGVSRLPFGSGGMLVPRGVEISYVAGFELGKIPENIKDVVMKEASSGPLNIGGDLVGGAAIASQSMSVDGLSQSVNTTSSPTMAGFGARLIQYNNELKRDYPIITQFYKGPRLYVG